MDDIKQRVEELMLLANDLAASNQELDNKFEALQSENKRLREALESIVVYDLPETDTEVIVYDLAQAALQDNE